MYLHPKAEAVVTEPDAYLIRIIKQRRAGEREKEIALEGEGVSNWAMPNNLEE